MKLRVGKRAQKQAESIGEWWVEHSPASPDLFAGELEQTFHHICSVHVAGVGWQTPRRPTLRRILMPRSQNHVYFEIHERTQTVHVLAIWRAPRGTVPKL